jgi:hypothetical protein
MYGAEYRTGGCPAASCIDIISQACSSVIANLRTTVAVHVLCKSSGRMPQCRAIFAVTTMIGSDQALHSCHHQVSSASQIHRGIFLRLQRCRIPKLPRRRHHDTTSSAPSVVWWRMATIETTILRHRQRWHQRAHAIAVCLGTLMLHEIRHSGFDFR